MKRRHANSFWRTRNWYTENTYAVVVAELARMFQKTDLTHAMRSKLSISHLFQHNNIENDYSLNRITLTSVNVCWHSQSFGVNFLVLTNQYKPNNQLNSIFILHTIRMWDTWYGRTLKLCVCSYNQKKRGYHVRVCDNTNISQWNNSAWRKKKQMNERNACTRVSKCVRKSWWNFLVSIHHRFYLGRL